MFNPDIRTPSLVQDQMHPARTGPPPPREVLLNVDLLGLTPVYITHLDRWRPFYHCAVDDAFVRRLVHRYEYLWLPLLNNWQQLDLEPPADIHWVWQLHLLQPNHYANYCREKFGRILPHRIRKYDRESATALQRTASLWRDTYPGTPFEADLDHLRSGAGDVQRNGTKLGDLVEVALNELEFLYQIGLSHYRDQSFQYAAVERYKKLLLFKSMRPTERLRLPVDVQLVWRVHLLHPIQYAEDTRRIFGNPVYALGPMDFEAHFMLIAESNNIWREEFGEELFLDGTGYRGHESSGRALIHPFPRENYDRRTIESCEISLDNLTVDEIWTKEKKIVVEVKLLGENSFAQETVFRTQGSVGSAMGGGGPGSAKVSGESGSMVGRTHFDTRRNKGLEFHILGRKGLGCISREHTVATKLFNPVQYFQNLPSLSGGTQLVVLPKVTYTDPKISFEMTVKAAAPKPHVFTLDRNPSELGPLPLDFRQFAASLQPWAVAMATPGENQFQHARHRYE